MMYHIHNTTSWSFKQIQPYTEPLTRAVNQFIEKFKDDITHEEFAVDIVEGRHQLWLILDNKGGFKGFLTTQVTKTSEGKLRVTLCQLAGEGAASIAPLITQIEHWAKTLGATEIFAIARFGWAKYLAQHGYRPSIIKYRKELSHGREYARQRDKTDTNNRKF